MVERGIRIANGFRTRLLIGHEVNGNGNAMVKSKITGNGNGIGNAIEN